MVAINKVEGGAPIEGEILATIMHTTGAIINPELTNSGDNKLILDKVVGLPRKLNTNDDVNMRAYSALVTNIWPAITDKVRNVFNFFEITAKYLAVISSSKKLVEYLTINQNYFKI